VYSTLLVPHSRNLVQHLATSFCAADPEKIARAIRHCFRLVMWVFVIVGVVNMLLLFLTQFMSSHAPVNLVEQSQRQN